MINGSDMLNVRKAFQSSTLQLIKDIQDIVERNNKSKASAIIRAEAFNLLFRNTVRVPKQEQKRRGWQHQTP